MDVKQINEALDTLIAETVKRAFVKEYQAKATPQEALGILIANYFEWDGLRILETASSALEDANFHTESAIIEEMIEKMK